MTDQLYINTISAYRNNDINKIIEMKNTFLNVLTDIDDILSCDEHFLLSKWLEAAKSSATNNRVFIYLN